MKAPGCFSYRKIVCVLLFFFVSLSSFCLFIWLFCCSSSVFFHFLCTRDLLFFFYAVASFKQTVAAKLIFLILSSFLQKTQFLFFFLIQKFLFIFISLQIVLLFLLSGFQWKWLWCWTIMSRWRQRLLRKWRYLQVSILRTKFTHSFIS